MTISPIKRDRRRAPSIIAAAFAAAMAASALSGCATPAPTGGPVAPAGPATRPPPPPAQTAPIPSAPVADAIIVSPVTPPHLAGKRDLVRAALLLPFTSADEQVRRDSAAMLNAAQLAIFESNANSLVLIPKDTGKTDAEARAAARSALADGADVIVGPLFATSVAAVTHAIDEAVFDTPVIAFSSDPKSAGPDAYLLSVLPEEEIGRIVAFAAQQLALGGGVPTPTPDQPSTPLVSGVRFAVLAPDGAYGTRVRDAATEAARLSGGAVTVVETYPLDSTPTSLTPIISRLAARVNEFDAVILPAGGVRLRQLAALLPYNDIDPRKKKLLGVSLWDNPDTASEPPLDQGWFPTSDPDARAAFAARYRDTYGSEPGRLAPFAYDAVALVAEVTRSTGAAGLTREAIERPEGFAGASGLFRFSPERTSEHALAVMEVRSGRFLVIDEAARSFSVF